MVMLCCTLIHSLARASADNQAKLGAAGACRAVAVAICRYAHSCSFAAINAAPTPTTPATPATPLSPLSPLTRGGRGDGAGAVAGAGAGAEAEGGSTLPLQPLQPLQLPLAQIVGHLGVLKEGCRALCCLCALHEGNKEKFHFTNVLDVLTQVLASSAGMSMGVGGGGLGDEGSPVYSEETMQWVKSAVDALIGR
jgi:hypothetical protein